MGSLTRAQLLPTVVEWCWEWHCSLSLPLFVADTDTAPKPAQAGPGQQHSALLSSPRATTLRRHGLAEDGRAHSYSPTEQILWKKLLVRVFLLWHIKRFAATLWNMSPPLNPSWVIRACMIFRGNCSLCFCCLPGNRSYLCPLSGHSVFVMPGSRPHPPHLCWVQKDENVILS